MKRHLSALATLVLAVQAHASPCQPWANPGANKNTQWPELSVLNYNAPQSHALHDLIKERAYVELASVRGGRVIGESSGREYAVSDMHYGNGKHCTGPVELPAAAENQFGFVYESGGMLVWVPFICNNVSILTPLEGPRALVPPVQALAFDDFEGGGVQPVIGGAPSVGYGSTGVVPGYAAAPLPYYGSSYGGFYAGGAGYGGGGGIGGGGYCYYCSFCPVAPIPEISTWLMLAAGIAAIVIWRHRRL